jgi:hypothetical protein
MLRGFLVGLAAHLTPHGEGWLILSDLAEHLGLRPRAQLLGWIADPPGCAGARARSTCARTTPRPPTASDPLHAARAAESYLAMAAGASSTVIAEIDHAARGSGIILSKSCRPYDPLAPSRAAGIAGRASEALRQKQRSAGQHQRVTA